MLIVLTSFPFTITVISLAVNAFVASGSYLVSYACNVTVTLFSLAPSLVLYIALSIFLHSGGKKSTRLSLNPTLLLF